jgi:hypothetical protein
VAASAVHGQVTDVDIMLLAPSVGVGKRPGTRVVGGLALPVSGGAVLVIATTRACLPGEVERYRSLQREHAAAARAEATADSVMRAAVACKYPNGTYFFVDLAIPTS